MNESSCPLVRTPISYSPQGISGAIGAAIRKKSLTYEVQEEFLLFLTTTVTHGLSPTCIGLLVSTSSFSKLKSASQVGQCSCAYARATTAVPAMTATTPKRYPAFFLFMSFLFLSL